jgi:GNAT superfamily N-acetyltransferase
MSETALSPATPVLSFSPIESDRFGFRIFRGRASDLDTTAISQEVLDQSVDIAMIRVPSASQYRVAELMDTGLPVMVADTVVYYRADLMAGEPPSPRNKDISFVACRPEQAPDLAALARDAFQGYRNHYSSNPLLRSADIVDAFVDWATRFGSNEVPGQTVWLAVREGRPIGFGACAANGNTADGVLFGVAPAEQGHGVFGDLIRFCQRYFQEQGCCEMLYSTQTQNLAVQSVLVREGFRPHNSLATIHINSLLSRSVKERHTERFPQSALHNPHSAILELAARQYETGFPGPGTEFLSASCRAIGPVHAEREYEMVISFPCVDEEQLTCKSVVKVRDDRGALCLLAYHDLTCPSRA